MIKKISLIFTLFISMISFSACTNKDKALDDDIKLYIGDTELSKDHRTEIDSINNENGIVNFKIDNINNRYYYTIYFNEMKDTTKFMDRKQRRDSQSIKKKSLNYKLEYDDTDPFLVEGDHRVSILITKDDQNIPNIIDGSEKGLIEYEYSIINSIYEDDDIEYDN